MKKLSVFFALLLAVFFLLPPVGAQTTDSRLRAFKYVKASQKNAIYSFDLQKIREWGELERLLNTPNGKQLQKDPRFGKLFRSIALGDKKMGIDFNATLVLSMTEDELRVIVPLSDVAKFRKFWEKTFDENFEAVKPLDAEPDVVYLSDIGGEIYICCNQESLIFHIGYGIEAEKDLISQGGDAHLAKRLNLAREVTAAAHSQGAVLIENPAWKEHVNHLTGLDFWMETEVDSLHDFGVRFPPDLFSVALWPKSSCHAFIDEKGLHATSTYVGSAAEVAEFTASGPELLEFVDSEMIARLPNVTSISFDNMAGPKKIKSVIDTVTIASVQQLSEYLQIHPWVNGSLGNSSNHVSITRYDNLEEAARLLDAFCKDFLEISERISKPFFIGNNKAEMEYSKEALADGGYHYKVEIIYKRAYWIEVADVEDVEEVIIEAVEDVEDVVEDTVIQVVVVDDAEDDAVIDSIGEEDYYVFGREEMHWLLKDGFLAVTNDSTLYQALLEEPEDSPLKQRAMAHAQDPYYVVSNSLAVVSELEFGEAGVVGTMEGVAEGNVFRFDIPVNAKGKNALAYLLQLFFR